MSRHSKPISCKAAELVIAGGLQQVGFECFFQQKKQVGVLRPAEGCIGWWLEHCGMHAATPCSHQTQTNTEELYGRRRITGAGTHCAAAWVLFSTELPMPGAMQEV